MAREPYFFRFAPKFPFHKTPGTAGKDYPARACRSRFYPLLIALIVNGSASIIIMQPFKIVVNERVDAGFTHNELLSLLIGPKWGCHLLCSKLPSSLSPKPSTKNNDLI